MITILNQACIQLTNEKGDIICDSQNRNINSDRHVTVETLSHHLKKKNEPLCEGLQFRI